MTWGSKKCKVVRGGASREENFGEVGELRVGGGCVEGSMRRRVFVKSLLLCSFVLTAHR